MTGAAERSENSSPPKSSQAVSRLAHKLRHLNPVTCESDEPILVGFEDVSAAAYRIRKGVKKTPCEVST